MSKSDSRHQTLTAGRSIPALITRSIIVVTVIATLAIITTGLLKPAIPVTQPFSPSSSSLVPVGLQIGSVAPNFTLARLDDVRVSLSDYRDKAVILNFWYATCPGCLAEIPAMQRFYASQRAEGRSFVILSVNSVDDEQTTRQFVQQYNLTYPVLLDEHNRVATLYNLEGTPTSYFIDLHGIIRSMVVGPVDETILQQKIIEIMT